MSSDTSTTDNMIIDMKTVTPTQAAQVIDAMWDTGISTYLHGKPGIAKSAIMQEAATKRGIAFLDFRLSQIQPEDLRGIPLPVTIREQEGLRWVTPHILPRDINYRFYGKITRNDTTIIDFVNPRSTKNNIFYVVKPSVKITPLDPSHVAKWEWSVDEEDGSTLYNQFELDLFDTDGNRVLGEVRVEIKGKCHCVWALEEFNSGSRETMAACYELVLDRFVGEYKVPAGVIIVAAGNNDNDRGVTNSIPMPVANRFAHFHVVESWPCWQRWAIDKMIHPQIMGYLSSFPEELMMFNEDTQDLSFATPRSWEMWSKTLYRNEDKPYELISKLCYGEIGSVAAKFMLFRNLAVQLPDLEKVLTGTLQNYEFARSHRSQLSAAFTIQGCYRLRSEITRIRAASSNFKQEPEYMEWMKRADNFVSFLETSVDPDMMIATVRIATATYNLPFNGRFMPALKRFTDKQGETVLAA